MVIKYNISLPKAIKSSSEVQHNFCRWESAGQHLNLPFAEIRIRVFESIEKDPRTSILLIVIVEENPYGGVTASY